MDKKYAICYNKEISHSADVKDELSQILRIRGMNADILDIDALKTGYDFVFVIGGDGTILKAARFFAKTETAIFGVNLGRLGFLSQSSKEHIRESVEKILFDNPNRFYSASPNWKPEFGIPPLRIEEFQR